MIGRVSGGYNLEALNNKKSKRSVSYNGSSASEEADNAKFSSFGTLLSKASAEMKNIPDVREDVVANFKTQIEEGTYEVPLDKLAGRLIVMGMLDVAAE